MTDEQEKKQAVTEAEQAPVEDTTEEAAPSEEQEEKKEEQNTEEKKEEPERRKDPFERQREESLNQWTPKTVLGKEVKHGAITKLDDILSSGKKILEPEIVDTLISLKSDLLSIGQSKGKFGGGKRRAWRQTQRKTKEGNVPTFSTMAVVGDENGYIGIGSGRATETLPARDKATRKAKLNIFKVTRACAAFDCACSELHTIPFEVTGKSGSVGVHFIPAPQGTGLVVADQLKKILKLAGIKDVYSRTTGRKRTTFNLIKAAIDALEKTSQRT